MPGHPVGAAEVDGVRADAEALVTLCSGVDIELRRDCARLREIDRE